LEPSERYSKTLVAALKAVRERQHISQSQLAKLSGLSRPMINHIESGRRNPTVIVVHALCSALGVSLSGVAAEIEQEIPSS
jgi:transcriptional regulator with XRE-family HTH domain